MGRKAQAAVSSGVKKRNFGKAKHRDGYYDTNGVKAREKEKHE